MDDNKSNIAIDLLIQKLVSRLRMLGFGEVTATRVIEFFSAGEVLAVIKANPYDLMKVPGISFKRADNIALNTGVARDDPRRQRAIVMHILEEATNSGHVYLPANELEKRAKKEKVDLSDSSIVDDLVEEDILVIEEINIYLKKYHMAEAAVAAHLKIRQTQPNTCKAISVNVVETDWDRDQLEFMSKFSDANVSVLTGGPGTGKTTVTKAICDLLVESNSTFVLCAPTGKAAKRCSELTGRPATTIHRLLKAKPHIARWGYNKHNKLIDLDYLIVDESSMLDIMLAYRILEALLYTTNIIFIGDVDQLQPVGPGSFFTDLIKSGIVPIFRLETNHRQGRGSLIADNALAINRGSLRFNYNNEDFFYVEAENSPVVREKLMHIISVLKEKLGYTDFVRDVQVLTPQKKTTIGTVNLNELLRFRINPHANPDEEFSLGDKIMQISNDYNLGIFNGFVGQIVNITQHHFEIDFFDSSPDSKIIKYPKNRRRGLMHAYACTVHKFQGSEVKVGIVVVSSAHSWMLKRNLVYTAITRCKEVCVLVGDKMGLKYAIKNNREQVRYSSLLKKLQEEEKSAFRLKR